jgi:hypothetical protein
LGDAHPSRSMAHLVTESTLNTSQPHDTKSAEAFIPPPSPSFVAAIDAEMNSIREIYKNTRWTNTMSVLAYSLKRRSQERTDFFPTPRAKR